MKVKTHHLTRLSSKFNQGYTLIELLVVIMIIGILSAIALPSFSALLNKSKSVEAQSNLNYLVKSQEIYYKESGETFTDSLEKLGFPSPRETENYYYTILKDNNYGAIHAALSKKIGVKSYVNVMYLKNGELEKCSTVPIPLMYPVNPIALSVVLSNPTNYCR